MLLQNPDPILAESTADIRLPTVSVGFCLETWQTRHGFKYNSFKVSIDEKR
jgi:hypothetical protein